MSKLKVARQFQEQDRLYEAASIYEEILKESPEDLSLDDYLDSALVYFVCTDFGFATTNRLPDDFARKAFSRAKCWLQHAAVKFGCNLDIWFWNQYFDFVVLGTDEFVAECLSRTSDRRSLIPYLHVYASTRDHRYACFAQELLALNQSGTTARQRYITSVLRGVL